MALKLRKLKYIEGDDCYYMPNFFYIERLSPEHNYIPVRIILSREHFDVVDKEKGEYGMEKETKSRPIKNILEFALETEMSVNQLVSCIEDGFESDKWLVRNVNIVKKQIRDILNSIDDYRENIENLKGNVDEELVQYFTRYLNLNINKISNDARIIKTVVDHRSSRKKRLT